MSGIDFDEETAEKLARGVLRQGTAIVLARALAHDPILHSGVAEGPVATQFPVRLLGATPRHEVPCLREDIPGPLCCHEHKLVRQLMWWQQARRAEPVSIAAVHELNRVLGELPVSELGAVADHEHASTSWVPNIVVRFAWCEKMKHLFFYSQMQFVERDRDRMVPSVSVLETP